MIEDVSNPEADSATTNELAITQKNARIEKQKQALLTSLDSGNYSTLKNRVAAILNLYPHCRNSDVALSLKYWETFQPEIFNTNGIAPKDLFKLERLHYLVRARAKIQNEYGLFQADEGIRRHRRIHEEAMQEAVVEDRPPRRVISIFSDESGKTEDFTIVSSVWILTENIFTLDRAIQHWKKDSPFANREIHFSRLKRDDLDALSSYLDLINNHRAFLSIKLIAVQRNGLRLNNEKVLEKLHEHMLIQGIQHEIENGRITLPRELEVRIDEEQSLDSFTLAEIRRRVNLDFHNNYNGQACLNSINTANSRRSNLIQLADLIGGAFNRKINFHGERNYKDAMADLIIEKLEIRTSDDQLPGIDSTALIYV